MPPLPVWIESSGRALELIAAKGPSGFTFAEAAPPARVSPAAPHRHFRDREELLANVARRGLRDQWRAGTIRLDDVETRVRAWIAHAEHADTWRLRHAIFRGGRFDPAKDLEAWMAPCRRVVRGGSWNRNRNTTDNRNNNLGFRVGSTLSARAGAITVAPGEHY